MSGRPPREPPEVSRRRLVFAAIDVIAERGVDGATVARIGSAAGMSRGAVGFHFGTQDELFGEVALEVSTRIPIPAPSGPPAEETVEDTIRWLVMTYLAGTVLEDGATRARMALSYRAITGHFELRPVLLAHRSEGRKRIVGYLEPWRSRGAIDADVDLHAVATGLWAAFEGLTLTVDDEADPSTLVEISSELARSFATQLSAHDGT